MKARSSAPYVLAVVAISLASCSGGGTSSPISPRPSPSVGVTATPNGASLSQRVAFTVDVPASSAQTLARRRSDGGVYVSPGIASISIALVSVNGAPVTPPPPATTATVPATCQPPCSFSVPGVVAAIGTNAYDVTTADAKGDVLSHGLVDVAVDASGNVSKTLGDPTQLSIGGVVASLALSIAPPSFTANLAGSAVVHVVARDASNNAIVGLTQYAAPIALQSSGAGFTLDGPALSGSTLARPESPSTLVFLRYDGHGASATLTATTTTASGATISASTSIAANASPATPSPTPTPVPTPTPAPPADFSLYALNGADNTVTELGIHMDGSTPDTRRQFGGSTVGCPPDLANGYTGAQALAIDPAGTAYVGATGFTCGGVEQVVQFAATAAGSTPPTLVNDLRPVLPGYRGAYEMRLSAPNNETVRFADDGGNAYERTLDVSAAAPNQLDALGDYFTSPDGQTHCLTSLGLQNFGGTNPCSDTFDAFFGDFESATLPNGDFVTDSLLLPTGSDVPLYALLFVPQQATTFAPFARQFFVLGTNLDLLHNGTTYDTAITQNNGSAPSRIAAMAEDDRGILYILFHPVTVQSASGQVGGFGGCGLGTVFDLCVDRQGHDFLAAYDTTQFADRSGYVDPMPIFVLGGDTVGRFAPSFQVSKSQNLTYAGLNAMVVRNGKIFIANPIGADCDDACVATLGAASGPTGEIDVYDASVRGIHINDAASAPVQVIKGTSVANPVALAVGPTGTATGMAGLRRMAGRHVTVKPQLQRRALIPGHPELSEPAFSPPSRR